MFKSFKVDRVDHKCVFGGDMFISITVLRICVRVHVCVCVCVCVFVCYVDYNYIWVSNYIRCSETIL